MSLLLLTSQYSMNAYQLKNDLLSKTVMRRTILLKSLQTLLSKQIYSLSKVSKLQIILFKCQLLILTALSLNTPRMLTLLKILKCGGMKTIAKISTSTDNLKVQKIGKNSKRQSRRLSASFLMIKLMKLLIRSVAHGNS